MKALTLVAAVVLLGAATIFATRAPARAVAPDRIHRPLRQRLRLRLRIMILPILILRTMILRIRRTRLPRSLPPQPRRPPPKALLRAPLRCV